MRRLIERLAYIFLVGGFGQLALIVVWIRMHAFSGFWLHDPLFLIGLAGGLMAFVASLPVTWALLSGRARQAAAAIGARALLDLLTPVIVVAVIARRFGAAEHFNFALAASAAAVGLELVLGALFYRRATRPPAPIYPRIAAAAFRKKPTGLR